MSEFQYYEFQAIDRPLSAATQRALRRIPGFPTIGKRPLASEFSTYFRLIEEPQKYDAPHVNGAATTGGVALAVCSGVCTNRNGGFDEKSLPSTARIINDAGLPYGLYDSNNGARALCSAGGGGAKCGDAHPQPLRLAHPFLLKQILKHNHDKTKALVDVLLSIDELPEEWHESLNLLKRARGAVLVKAPYTDTNEEDNAECGRVLFAKLGIKGNIRTKLSGESSTESDSIGSRGCCDGAESLVDHSLHVRDQAREFCDRLNLPKRLSDDVALAAFLHDIGKSDTRFQRYLMGPWYLGEVVAKSGKRRNPREDAAARRNAELPSGWRHEALSVRIARLHPAFSDANDRELVLWLIGTHHGHGRPQFPCEEPRDDERHSYYGFAPFEKHDKSLAVDPSPGPQRVDFTLDVSDENGTAAVDWPQMFQRLKSRYGIWGLAYLEAAVRLADHRASEVSAPQKKGDLDEHESCTARA